MGSNPFRSRQKLYNHGGYGGLPENHRLALIRVVFIGEICVQALFTLYWGAKNELSIDKTKRMLYIINSKLADAN